MLVVACRKLDIVQVKLQCFSQKLFIHQLSLSLFHVNCLFQFQTHSMHFWCAKLILSLKWFLSFHWNLFFACNTECQKFLQKLLLIKTGFIASCEHISAGCVFVCKKQPHVRFGLARTATYKYYIHSTATCPFNEPKLCPY